MGPPAPRQFSFNFQRKPEQAPKRKQAPSERLSTQVSTKRRKAASESSPEVSPRSGPAKKQVRWSPSILEKDARQEAEHHPSSSNTTAMSPLGPAQFDLSGASPDVFVTLRQRDAHEFRSLLDSEGHFGGLDGDVVYIKSQIKPMTRSGFYFVGTGSYSQLSNGGEFLSVTETMGPRAKCEVLDPREAEDVGKIVNHVRKLKENNCRNASLKLGLRTAIRHASMYLGQQQSACSIGQRLLAAQCGEKGAVHEEFGSEMMARTSGLDKLQGCWNRCFPPEMVVA